MLVRILAHGGVQEAYTNKQTVGCGCCGAAILPGFPYTLHLFPNKAKINPLTNRYEIVPFMMCSLCAPFRSLEDEKKQNSGEMQPVTEKVAAIDDPEKTEHYLPAVKPGLHIERNNTPRPEPKPAQSTPRTLRHKVVLSPHDKDGWIR